MFELDFEKGVNMAMILSNVSEVKGVLWILSDVSDTISVGEAYNALADIERLIVGGKLGLISE